MWINICVEIRERLIPFYSSAYAPADQTNLGNNQSQLVGPAASSNYEAPSFHLHRQILATCQSSELMIFSQNVYTGDVRIDCASCLFIRAFRDWASPFPWTPFKRFNNLFPERSILLHLCPSILMFLSIQTTKSYAFHIYVYVFIF